MDIIKEAVLRIDRDSGRRIEEQASQPVPVVPRRFTAGRSTQQVLTPEELAAKRIYHSSMRDERVHDAFTNLRTHVIQRTGNRSCSIVVSAVVAGGGASFVALNLAAAFASDTSGFTVLVDCNFAGSRYRDLGDSESTPGITDYVDGAATSIDELLIDVGIANLRLLGGGTGRSTQREYFTRPRAQKMFAELASQYEDCTVVVDAPPALVSANANVLAKYCDAALLVVPYGRSTQQDARVAIRSLPPGKLIGSVFNDVPHWHIAG